MNAIHQTLADLGLNETEINIYLAMLQTGTTPASILATKTKINRSTARHAADQLVSKKLATKIQKSNTFLFTPENPDKILYLLEAEKQKIARKEKEAKKIINQLKFLQGNANPNLPKVQFFEGLDGLDQLFSQYSKNRGDVYTFSAGDYFLEKTPKHIDKFRNTVSKDFTSKKIIRAPKYKDKHLNENIYQTKTKYFNKLKELTVDIQIFQDNLICTSIDDKTPIGIVIKNQQVADSFKKIFQELWDNLES